MAVSAVISIVLILLAAAAAGYQAYQSSQDAKDMARYNRRVANNNALAQRYAAEQRADVQKSQDDVTQARYRAAAAAGGVEGDTGSALLLEIENAQQSELNQTRIRYGGEMAAYGYEREAELQRFIGKKAKAETGSRVGLSVLGSLAGNAGSIPYNKPSPSDSYNSKPSGGPARFGVDDTRVMATTG